MANTDALKNNNSKEYNETDDDTDYKGDNSDLEPPCSSEPTNREYCQQYGYRDVGELLVAGLILYWLYLLHKDDF